MKLHIFNPEHDIALAANLSNFTAPHAGRQLRHDLGYLPAIWAAPEDYVLVDDVEVAKTAFSRLMHRQYDHFIDKKQLLSFKLNNLTVEPWGWNLALRSFLLRCGLTAVPSEEGIADIRDLSHRKHAVDLLRKLDFDGTTGCSWCTDLIVAVQQAIQDHGGIVVKAPWSSSGRGIRFIDGALDAYQQRWIENVVARQRCVVIEKYCHKVKDFGMEFESDGEGRVSYLGLSLFHTQNGAYTGNILATEEEKLEMISRYISIDRLNAVKEKICTVLGLLYRGKYEGPFGIDLMIVRGSGNGQFLLHPCVEINLRRTMGHVALELSKHFPSGSTMNIVFSDNRYRLNVAHSSLIKSFT